MAVKSRQTALSVAVYRTILLLTTLLLASCLKDPDSKDLVVFTGSTMGTTYSIKVSGNSGTLSLNQVQREIETHLERINRSMSTYIPKSEISRFNRFRNLSPFPVSLLMFEVLDESLRISGLTGGALDITVAPLVNLWGFGVDTQTTTVPSDEVIKSLKKRTGYKKIKLTKTPTTIRKLHPEITIDLSAIAKGYAVDQISLLLKNKGLSDHLVEIGGEIRTSGFKENQTPWIVGIERPVSGEQIIQQVVSIGSNSMATSGDYRNYFEKNGKRFSHLIDPNSGRPIEHKLASVSVIHQSCMTADAFATAFMIMGPDKAHQLALNENLAAYFLIRTQSGYQVTTTPAFNVFLDKN